MTSGRPRSIVSVRPRAAAEAGLSGRRSRGRGRNVVQEEVIARRAGPRAGRAPSGGSNTGPCTTDRPSPATSAGAIVSTRSSTSPSASSSRSSVGPPSLTTTFAPSLGAQVAQARASARASPAAKRCVCTSAPREAASCLGLGVDEQALLGLGEQRDLRQARVERARDRRHQRLARQAASDAHVLLRRVEQRRVALGDQRRGADEQRVGGAAQLTQDRAVGGAAEAAGAAVDGRAAVSRADHRDDDARSLGVAVVVPQAHPRHEVGGALRRAGRAEGLQRHAHAPIVCERARGPLRGGRAAVAGLFFAVDFFFAPFFVFLGFLMTILRRRDASRCRRRRSR